LSYYPILKMKNLFIVLPAIWLLFSCNSSSEQKLPASDSLQHLLQTIRDSIQKYPDDPRPKYNLAIVLQDAGRYQEAVRALDSMNIAKGDSANMKMYFAYLFKRAELLKLSGDTSAAIKNLELFVLPGEPTEAGFLLANLYAETKNPKTVSFCNLLKKSDATGDNPNPDYILGVYYYNRLDYDSALRHFEECIVKDYNFLDAHMEKGTIYYKQKKYEEAFSIFDRVISISHTYADAYYWKARCEEEMGKTADAVLNYRKAYGLDLTLTEAKEAADRIKKNK
jgi:tetratricopeptide (TPR) repeat protein